MNNTEKYHHEIFDYMKSVESQMAEEFERISKRTKENPSIAGQEGEENWAHLFRNWLPSNYHIVTRGRILSSEGVASDEVDVLVMNPSYPKHLLNKKLHFAGGVIAAFECKLKLLPSHLKKIFHNCKKIKLLESRDTGNPYDELNSQILFGILAHSHGWKSKNDTLTWNIHKSIDRNAYEIFTHPIQLPDVICIANVSTFTGQKMLLYGNDLTEDEKQLLDGIKEKGTVASGYFSHSFYMDENISDKGRVLGSLISFLTTKLAYKDNSIRPFAQYLLDTFIEGVSIGTYDLWGNDEVDPLFTIEVLNKLKSDGTVEGLWSKWAKYQ